MLNPGDQERPSATLLWLIAAPMFWAQSLHAITFEDATAAAGVNGLHHFTYLATGQAWGDYDNDGFEDLYLTDGNGPNSLYRNLGDGTFVLSEHNAGVSLPGANSGGAAFADYDNDGDQDLIVVNYGNDNLFENTASGFVDVTASAGLNHFGVGESAAWADFNNDGYLDLYISNWTYIEISNPEIQDRFYLNNGDGTFSDVSYLLGIDEMKGPAYAATFIDYDNDGDLDIYVVNDKYFGNKLWRNDGAGCGLWCFTEVSEASGSDRPADGMCIATGDYDLDGDDDFYYSSVNEMILLQSQIAQGYDSFSEVTDTAGVNVSTTGWGCVFADFDNDGWEDLYLATAGTTAGHTNRVFRNTGSATFEDVSTGSGASPASPSMGVAYADYDLDGRMDLVVANTGNSYRLYRNTSSAGNWLSVRLSGAGPVNRDAVGARALLSLSDGRVLSRRVHIGSSIGADHQRALHFGLGTASPVDLEVRWPDGLVESFSTIPVNSAMSLTYPLVQDGVFEDGFEN